VVTSDQDHDNTIDDEKPTQDNDAEDDGGSGWKFQMPRPSEQWEVVMESIEELEENSSQGTLSSTRTLGSTGEFGTGNSKCVYNLCFIFDGMITHKHSHCCLAIHPSKSLRFVRIPNPIK
jgi:hypothetical protein